MAKIEFTAETAREWLATKHSMSRYAFTIAETHATDVFEWATKTESGLVYPKTDRSGWAFEYDVDVRDH